MAKISGLLLDRIDAHIEVPHLSTQELMTRSVAKAQPLCGDASVARAKQVQRLAADGLACNAQLRAKQLRQHCQMDDAAQNLLKTAINQFNLSTRAYDRILKVSRIIADLDDSEGIQMFHVAEAVNYCMLDRKLVI